MRDPDSSAATRARVVLAMSGDRGAFGQLVLEHQSAVRMFLRRLCRGDASTADDLAQNTFEKAWRKRSSFRGDGELRSWLMQIAFNEFRQNLRRRRPDEAKPDSTTPEEIEIALSQEDPRTEDLDRLLQELNDTERAVMVLSYGHGYSHREIAEALEQPVGSIKSLIHRSKERIRHRFRIAAAAAPEQETTPVSSEG